MKSRLGLSALFLLATVLSVSAGVIHVPGDYTLIHDAVQACAAGDTVEVAPGTYGDCTHPTDGDALACVIMKSGVILRGSGPDATIIDVAGLGRGIFVENVSNCRIENLQVTGAFAEIYGAGILLRHVGNDVEIRDVKIFENLDGGIICIYDSHPIIEDTDMVFNAAKQGGGLAVEEGSSPIVRNCNISNNEAPSGAGLIIRNLSNPVVENCVIADNTINAAFGAGGGVAVMNSSPQISDTEISGNLSLGYGGGIAYLDQSGGFLQNCKILNNVASNDFSVGGGISTNQSNPDIDGCLITGNSVPGAWGEGGGIDASFTPAPSISYCTIVGNSTGSGGTGGGIASQFDAAPSIYRSIIAFADNGLGVSCLYGSTPLLSCNDIYGNPGGDAVCGTDGGSNFSSDPLFCGTEGVEYNLQADSPCAAANNDCEVTLGSEPEDCSVDVVEGPLSAARLLGNAPNPFNPKTGIFFVLDTQGHASLRIHDIAGRLVKDLSPGSLPAGNHRVDWNGLDESGQLVPSGVYFYTLKALGLEQSRRMILIK